MTEPPHTADHPDTTCPVCAAAAQRGQLVCLECGSRITLSYRRPPSWKVPVAITVVVLVLAAAGAALAYQAMDDEAEREVAATPANPKENVPAPPKKEPSGGAAKAEDAPAKPDTSKPETEKKQPDDGELKLGDGDPATQEDGDPTNGLATGSGGLRKSGDLYVWPRSLRSFTVVLLSAEDKPSATSFARSASGRGGDKIGVIRSNDFVTLPRDFFVVFAGEYPNREKADQAAARLGGRFPGSFAQLVGK